MHLAASPSLREHHPVRLGMLALSEIAVTGDLLVLIVHKWSSDCRKSANGSHFKIRYKDRQTIFPSHGSKEIGEGLWKAIIKQLGLK
ncbi:type II toxin-antitoxin system HicA family toxin [Pseudomonas putida]